MSSGFQLRVSKYLVGVDVPANGVIANIYALDPALSANSKRSVVIPVGYSSNTFRQVDLEPGQYLIEAIMPSGDIISQQAIVKDGQWQEIALEAEQTAHEWHSWHNLTGSVRSSSAFEDEPQIKGIKNYKVDLIRDPRPELRGDDQRSDAVWKLLAALQGPGVKKPIPPHDFGLAGTADHPVASDKRTQLHSFRMNYHGPTEESPRWYVLVSTPKTQQLLTVPCPWFSEHREVPAELLVTKDEDLSITTSWVIQDPDLGTVLAYLANGSLQSALRIASHNSALQLLFDKFENPLGAAAGGYLLLANMKAGEKDDWHHWISNLRRYFQWLPDGCIQFAWLKLKQGPLEDSRAEVRLALFEAFDRGLPYYTLGLQWLVDGLTLLGEDDQEAVKRLKLVQRVSWRADMSNLFTNVNL
ncbi:MAG TPA: hypothetical protein VN643_01410 [Pyrinomonadaceae bacterium]|nr:hypothetical protein [Pyrinomonadaceae bacterium]